MKYIPKINSFKDFILWPIRFIFNLPIQWQAMLGLVATVPMILTVLLAGRGGAADRIASADKACFIKTGCLDNNIDSVRIRKGENVRLLARQGSLIWAETENGRNRGFVRGTDIFDSPDSFDLPQRRMNSSYFISKKKFVTLISDPETTLSSLQEKYISAEYLKQSGRNTTGEFGFHVIDSTGRQLRPVVTFSPDGTVADWRLEPWRSKRGLVHNGEIDFMSPLISTKEFQPFSPFDNWFTNLLWTYLVGYIPLFLFILLLWMRYPLIWMPNVLANLIIYALIVSGPLLWCSMLRVQGVAWWPVVPVTVILFAAGCLLFWALYSGLRCPRCKSLIYHEHTGSISGKEYVEVRTSRKEISRENLEHTTSGYWKYKLVKSGDDYVRRGTMEHRYVDRVTYQIYETRSVIQPLTNQYSCPHCGHGRDEKSRKVLESETIPKGTSTSIERYTREEVSGQPFDA